MKKLTSVALLLVLLLTSCYVTKTIPIAEDMDKWIGKNEQDVLMRLGPPTSTSSDGDGGKILIYENRRNGTAYLPYGNMVIAAPLNTFTYLHLFIGQGGKVYHWRTNLPDRKVKVKQ